MPLLIEVINSQQRLRLEHFAGPLEFGRGPVQKCARVVIDDMFVSRDQLRIEEIAEGRIRLDNLSIRNSIELGDGQGLAPARSRDLLPPLTLSVGKTRLVIARAGVPIQPAANETQRVDNETLTPEKVAATETIGLTGLATIDQPSQSARRAHRPLALQESVPDSSPDSLTHWLETVIELQQAPAGSVQFFEQTAQALLDLISLDLALVLIRREAAWSIVGSAVSNDRVCVHYSRTLLEHVAAQRRTFYQDLDHLRSDAVSLANIESAVVSPVLGLQGEVVGALYGARIQEGLSTHGGINRLEAQLVQLLAAAAGANMARSLAARTRVQFEQFFSPELVRELESNPKMLEGRTEEVTVLFSDLRGFTALSQRLGAEKTCRIVRDMMERLSERIVEHGGVIVDYAGDGILAMWNAPAKQADHAARACHAALAMLAELPALNARWGQETAGAALALGIGINTGEAQVGNTGSNRKFKYGPHGHTVNLASRVQDATKHLGLPLLVSDQTRGQLQAGFSTRRFGQVRMPGVKEPVVLHEVRDAQVDAAWLALRDAYEKALQWYEAAQWPRACETLMPLVAVSSHTEKFDLPTLKLLRRAWECLEARPESFEPIIEATTK